MTLPGVPNDIIRPYESFCYWLCYFNNSLYEYFVRVNINKYHYIRTMVLVDKYSKLQYSFDGKEKKDNDDPSFSQVPMKL